MGFMASVSAAELTPTERVFAAYLIDHAIDVASMKLHDLADASFASPAAVTRFCRKIGYTSYLDMQLSLTRELAENGSLVDIDADFPSFEALSIESAAHTLFSLKNEALRETECLLKSFRWNPLVNEIVHRRAVSLYGLGFSNSVAQPFAACLQRIGHDVVLEVDDSRMRSWATTCSERHVSILLSYSGETGLATIARLLAARGMKTVSITANVSNSLAELTTWNIPVARMGEPLANDRIAPFASMTAMGYALDLLYLLIFERDRERNAALLRNSLAMQAKVRGA